MLSLPIQYDDLETISEGIFDTRGRKGLADVPVHCEAINPRIMIRTDESEKRLHRLVDLMAR